MKSRCNFDISSAKQLLGRDDIPFGNSEGLLYLRDKCVLVTGGGGSVGAQLCLQIAGFEPKKIIVFDISESAAHDIYIRLQSLFPKIKSKIAIGSIRDSGRLERLFSSEKPDIIFHTAAHKHVPLMESEPIEAVENNIFGTINLVRCAKAHNADKFVLLSSDKAVCPVNVMGATKKVCEMIIRAEAAFDGTRFAAVRFGNVLGSSGSVFGLFKAQIESGEPVMLTHTDATRYFITIPEAARLVLEAASCATGGEVYLLDMGQPIKILDLAKRMIAVYKGKPPAEEDIKIIGLRAGEKLHERLFSRNEQVLKTKNPMILRLDTPMLCRQRLDGGIKGLRESANRQDEAQTAKFLMRLAKTDCI